MNKIIKYGFPVVIGMNVVCAIMSIILANYPLGLSQFALAIFMFLWREEKNK